MPFVSQCAIVEDAKNPTQTRCKNVPGKNGYFCESHYDEISRSKLFALIIRGMPHIIKKGFEVVTVYRGTPKKKKKVEPLVQEVIEKPKKIEEIEENIPEPDQEKISNNSDNNNSYIKRKMEYESMPIKDLIEIAKALEIKGRMKKTKLIEAIIEKELEMEVQYG